MGTQLPPPKKGGDSPPIFGPCLLWPNGWMVQCGRLRLKWSQCMCDVWFWPCLDFLWRLYWKVKKC